MSVPTTNDYCPHGYADFGRGCPDCDAPAHLPAVVELVDEAGRLTFAGAEYLLGELELEPLRVQESPSSVFRKSSAARRRFLAGGAAALVLAALAPGLAQGAPSPGPGAAGEPAKCKRVYPAAPVLEVRIGSQVFYVKTRPSSIDYLRCLVREGGV